MKIIIERKPNYIYEVSKLLGRSIFNKEAYQDLDDLLKKIELDCEEYSIFYRTMLENTTSILEKNASIKNLLLIGKEIYLEGLFLDMVSYINPTSFRDLDKDQFLKALYMALLYKNQKIQMSGDIDDENLHGYLEKIKTDKYDAGFYNEAVLDTNLTNEDKLSLIEFFNNYDQGFESYRKLALDVEKIYKKEFTLIEDFYQKTLDEIDLAKFNKNIKALINLEEWSYRKEEDLHFYLSPIGYGSMSFILTHDLDNEIKVFTGLIFEKSKDIIEEKKDFRSLTINQMKALGEDNRYKIIELLANKSMYLKELSDATKLTSATVSHHMDMLMTNQLVYVSNEGRKVYYHLNKESFKRLAVSIGGLVEGGL